MRITKHLRKASNMTDTKTNKQWDTQKLKKQCTEQKRKYSIRPLRYLEMTPHPWNRKKGFKKRTVREQECVVGNKNMRAEHFFFCGS